MASTCLRERTPLDHDLKVSSIPRASTMLECVSWCPSLKRKLPLSVVSVPVQHNFAGAGGALRGCFYMAEVMGKVLLHSNGIIRAVVFDAHGSHALIRRLLHGELHGLNFHFLEISSTNLLQSTGCPVFRLQFASSRMRSFMDLAEFAT